MLDPAPSDVAFRPAVLPFEDVYRTYFPRVYRLCLTLMRDPTLAEDIATDAFTSAFAAYERSAPDADGVLVWLFTIAKNAATDHWRKQTRWHKLLSTYTPPPSDDAEHLADVRQELREVLDTMTRLRPRDRMLVGLRIGAGLSYAEIAAVVGDSENTVRVATSRAVERLQKLLGREG